MSIFKTNFEHVPIGRINEQEPCEECGVLQSTEYSYFCEECHKHIPSCYYCYSRAKRAIYHIGIKHMRENHSQVRLA